MIHLPFQAVNHNSSPRRSRRVLFPVRCSSRMFSHERIWAAIDALASRHGLHTSKLARKAGLDATSFNKSKRVSRKGREHWPSTESISKILDVTGTTLKDFLRLIE